MQAEQQFVLAVHGGAGTIRRESLSADAEAQYRAGVANALKAGHSSLLNGGNAMDAVVAAVKVLEDDLLFNAGKGAVFTHEGNVELDAAVMDGRSGLAGAVAGVRTIKNPVVAARRVMDATKHVLLIGAGAEQFAVEQNLDLVAPEYFHTKARWQQFLLAKSRAQVELDHDGQTRATEAAKFEAWQTDNKFGTVGAVARDSQGNLAAATSTGGLTNKFYGRVGDSPIIGAGTYADNATVAVSGTGVGEFFMRGLIAYDIAARIKYLKIGLDQAVDQVIQSALDAYGGQGGVIAVDSQGQVKFGFNTEGMYRGYIRTDGLPVVAIYRE
jgi:beta-aspartyl-peptidase (threonine type)